MTEFFRLKQQINTLSRAEYGYDRLTSEFAERYLDMTKAGYAEVPDLQIFHAWLQHLHFDIRPAAVERWKAVAKLFGFALGDLIEVDGTQLYVVKAIAYPDLDYICFTGFNAKKDGSPGRTAVHINIKENTQLIRLGKQMEEAEIAPYFFEGSSHLPAVKAFIQSELAQLS